MKRRGKRVFVRCPRTCGVRAASLRRAVDHALAEAAPQMLGDVSVVVVDDRVMRSLNRQYRGFDSPTDVLAFPIGDGTHEGEPFGDIVISYETARRQARAYKAPLVREMQRLAVHGALHLCGYDHHERREAARMHGLTRKLLRELSAGA